MWLTSTSKRLEVVHALQTGAKSRAAGRSRASPIRLTILRLVVQGGPAGTAAGDIQHHVDMPASTLSHHLKRLVDAGLLQTRGEGTFHYYAPDFQALRGLTDLSLGGLLQAWFLQVLLNERFFCVQLFGNCRSNEGESSMQILKPHVSLQRPRDRRFGRLLRGRFWREGHQAPGPAMRSSTWSVRP